MKQNQDLQQHNNQLDKLRRKLTAAEQRKDPISCAKLKIDIEATNKKISGIKDQLSQQRSSQAEAIKAIAFNRALSKAEQGDLGKLKKTVRGLVVVHPLTALGRELGVTVVTGFAPKSF